MAFVAQAEYRTGAGLIFVRGISISAALYTKERWLSSCLEILFVPCGALSELYTFSYFYTSYTSLDPRAHTHTPSLSPSLIHV